MSMRVCDDNFAHIDESIKYSEIKNIKGQDILPFLLDKHPNDLQNGVKPSEMFAALRLSTEELLAKLRFPLRKYKIGNKGDAFVRCPEVIIFQNFELGQIYSTTLAIINQRGSPQNLKVSFETSKYFSISGNSDQNKPTRVNPGLSQSYKITFIPSDTQRDFFHIIRFSSDCEQFSVPIFALGSNPIVNIPDVIIMPPTVIKVVTEQTIVLKNSGNMDFNFSQVTEEPVRTDLVNGILPPNQILEVTYTCSPFKPGHNKGKIRIYFRHDFCLLIDVECEVGCVPLNIDPHYLSFDDTYMGLTSKKILTLHNPSDFTLNFAWKACDREEEEERIFKLKNLMEEMKNYEQTRYEKLKYMDIVDREEHEEIYERIFLDETDELLNTKEFLYQSNYFEIVPKVGKVLPRTQFEFVVIFTPQKNIPYESTAFLDIAGVEKRIKSSFLGYGIGPLVELVVKDLNIGTIYLTDKHQYEFVIANKGCVPATVTFQVKKCEWGGIINCSPESLKLEVNMTKMFLFTFYSKAEGEFIETLHFKVEESEEYLQCIFRGNVICPLLKCVPDSLDFGVTSAGVSSALELELVNDSRVAIEYDFQLHDSPKRYSDYIKVVPSKGKVPHFSNLTVQVSFFSETSLKLKTDLLLVMWKSKNHTKTIKLKGICSCPSITCSPSTINIKFCFINYVYLRTIKLQNASPSPGYVEFLEPKKTDDDDDPITCTPNQSKLYFEAYETKFIELKIIVSKLGSYHLNLYFSVTGGAVLNLCSVICNGQGPVVSYHPDEVNFGIIEVLKKCDRKLTIVNDCPIPATVRLQCKENTTFQISETPDKFELLPDAQYEITIWAELNTPGKHRDLIRLEVENSDDSIIKVSAEGKGTSILCEPQLTPLVNFGLLLTYKPFIYVVKVTNKGVLPYKLVFTKRSSLKSLKEVAEDDTTSNVFVFEPKTCEIHSTQSQELTIRTIVKTPKTVSEEYFCHALIGKSPVIRTIFNFTLQAEFVDPQISFSKREMDFDMHFLGKQSEGKLEDMVCVDNNTGIPIEMRFTVDDNEDNFTLIDNNSGWNSIEKKPSSMSVKYTPNIKEKRTKSQNARVIVEYQDHPKTDIINLHGVVIFPTIKLYPDKINFECVPCGSTCSNILIIQNVSAMIVKYEWFWLEESVTITELGPHKEALEPFKVIETKDNNTDFIAYIDNGSLMQADATRNSMETSAIDRSILSNDSQSNFSFDRKSCLEETRNVLFSVLGPHLSAKKSSLTIPIQNKPPDSIIISNIFSMEPREGILGPNEYTIITIGFNPHPETEISAAAICKVEGGEEEILKVIGKSSKLRYELDKLCINFGNQVFCDFCSNYLTLNNTGHCTLNFKVRLKECSKIQSDYMDVNPKCGSIFPGEIFSIKIDYLPGIPGIFSKWFILELGYLEAVPINVRGYAVLNQAYLELSRPATNLSLEDCYKAISWLTPEYLESVQGNGYVEIEDTPNDLRFLEENDWVYISYNDSYPTLIDISMAMERVEAYNTINRNLSLLKAPIFGEQLNSVPQFFLSPYVIDFGYVLREVPVCYTVKLLNYGPLSIEIKLLEDNQSELAEKELKIEFKPRSLASNESMLFSVVFAPTTRRFPELNKKIETSIRFKIKRGPIITVKIMAEVTLPVISILHKELIFENVYCGDVLRKSIVLSNDGNVTSKWTAVLLKPTKKRSANVFAIPNNGQLAPGRKFYLNIYFMPTDSRPIKQTLRIDVEFSSEPILLVLHGEGLEAHLTIEPAKLLFAPTVSYFETSLCFAVNNATEIPMEFYFSSLDSDSEYEKNLVDIYLKFKNVKYVFGPLRQAGHPLPDNFLNTYNTLVDRIRRKMLSAQKLDSVENGTTEVSDDGTNDPLLKYSPKEVHSLLLEYVEAEGFDNENITDTTMYHLEETSENIEIIEPPTKIVDEEPERNGALFIFHGAPNTDYFGGANQAGIVLSIPVYSIDRLIIESLIEKSSSVAIDIKNTIETAFSSISDVNAISLLESLETEDSEYDKLLEKIILIQTTKPKKKDKKSPAKDKKSQESSEKNQPKGKEKFGDCFLGIQLETFVELLKPKMKVLNNLIIESLHSTFIKSENQALYTVLRAAGAILLINIVIFSSTIKDIIKNEENRLQAEKSDTSQTKEVIIQEKSAPVTPVNRKANQSADGKMSKASADKKKGIDVSKKVLQSLSKALKTQLEEFENLFQEIVHVGQHWDKKHKVLKKQFSPGSKKESSTKDSARTMRNSVKKGSSSLTLEDNCDYGLNMWIIVNACNERGIDYRQMIGNRLNTDGEIQKILADIQENEKPKFEDFDTRFTVVSKPEQYRNEPSEVFIIRNFQETEIVCPAKSRSKSGSSLKVRRRRGSKSSKRSVDSRSGAETVISFAKAECDAEFCPKMVLEPGSQAKYLVTFSPRICGLYKYQYSLETTRTTRPYNVSCKAVCELPKIDTTPEFMFPKTLENYKEKATYDHFVYIKDQKIFDFGSVIAGSTPLGNRLCYSSTILLKNISSITCNIVFGVSNDLFEVKPLNLVIVPKNEDIVTISTTSSAVGTFTCEMCISVKDNPRVETFTLAYSSSKLELSISPKLVNFDKVPLYCTVKRAIRLTNSSPISLRWELADAAWATEIFDIPDQSGFIELYSFSDIIFKFYPIEELLLSRKNLQIKLYDVNCSSTEPCLIENVGFHADSVDYNLDLPNHIEYGEVKGGVETKTTYAITNKGKHEVLIKIDVANNPLENINYVREYFKIKPLELSIGAQKTENISIFLYPKSNFSVENLFLFVVSIVENFDAAQPVKTYKVNTSITSFMPCYDICPPSHLSFGDVALQNSKKLLIDITNNGRFSFGFTILNYSKVLEAQKKVKLGGKGAKDKNVGSDSATAESQAKKKKPDKNENSKATTSEVSKRSKGDTTKESGSKAEKRKPIKVTKLDVGGFVVTPAVGVVYPNENILIEVEVALTEPRDYKEQMLVKISEIEEVEKNKIITLTATGCEQKVDLKSWDHIFMEQNIVTDIGDFVIPKQVDGCCVFAVAEQTLYFKQICLHDQSSTGLHFKNIGSVTSNLMVKIDDFGKSVFSVSEYNIIIEPYTEGTVQVTFKPHSLEVFNGTLQISTNASTDNKLMIYLVGETCLPRFKLIDPPTDSNETSINFGPICVGYKAFKGFCVKNIGPIKAKLITELSESNEQMTIVPADDYSWKSLIKEEVNMQNNLVLNLLAGDVAKFDIWYTPSEEGIINSTVILHTISNPYETIKIKIEALGYNSNIVMEGLIPLKLNRSSTSDASIINKNSIGYLLDLGYKELNKLYKTSFLLKNRSTENTYKFRFYSSTMVFSPELGHLKPGVTKEITVIFKATQPVTLKNEEVTCYINRIEYVNPNDTYLSWDDRQKCVYWTTNNDSTSNNSVPYSTTSIQEEPYSCQSDKHGNVGSDKSTKFASELRKYSGSDLNKAPVKTKVVIEGSEPEIITIPESFDVISVFLKVAADYARYECSKNCIIFEDTFITEEKIEEFEIINIGSVQLSVIWQITDENELNSLRKSNSDTKLNLTRWDYDDISLKSVTTISLMSSSNSEKIESFVPFSIIPEKVDINPGNSTKFTVLFSPKQIGSCKGLLTSNITSLDPSYEQIAIRISGTALPVPLYFEMENGSTCSKEVVLQFENIGVGTETTKHIFLVNPTVNMKNFDIAPVEKREFSHFICNKLTGQIVPNKKEKVSFSFHSPTYGNFKENYMLKIIENDVQKVIRLQGHCREPIVYFDKTNIALKPTIPHSKTLNIVKLKNEEDFFVNFKFIRKSFFSENLQEKLEILPVTGRLESQSECDIKIMFSTVNAVSTNFHVKCLVEKLKSPLNLLVSAASFSVKSTVSYVSKNGDLVYLGEDRVNVITCPIIKGTREKIQFQLTNQGTTGMYYEWEFDKKSSSLFKISISCENGFINSGNTSAIDLMLEPLRKGVFKDFKIKLKIMYGQIYIISLNAIVTNPNCKFSFERYNFGFCFLQKCETSFYSIILSFKNLENKKIFLENVFEKTSYFSLDFTSGFVSPGEVINIKISFHPQVKGQYSSNLPFIVSGWKHDILVSGEGVDLNLALCNPQDKLINFGDVLVNSSKKHRVGVTNKSPAMLHVRFDLYDNLMALQKTTSKLEDCTMQVPVVPAPAEKADKKNKSNKKNEKMVQVLTIEKTGRDRGADHKPLIESQEDIEKRLKEENEKTEFLKCFSILPNAFMDIPPKAKRYFDIVVQPVSRFCFNEKIYFETQDCLEPLCTIKGRSIVPDFSLDKTELVFPGVIIGCRSPQIIVIRNKGDVIGSFQWRFEDLKQEDFSLHPKDGFVLPNEDVKIDVVFAPKKIKCQINTKVKCHFKEIDKPLTVKLTGNAVKIPEPTSTITLTSCVRETAVDRTVLISNSTSQVWLVHVESSNKTFLTPEELTILPSTSVPLPITYCPKKMTGVKPDEGKIFIKYPDGGGLLYNVIGKAGPPTVNKKVEREINCKTNYYEDLVLENWLSDNQIFNVETDLLSPITTRMLYRILGAKTIELKGSEKKHYKWGVYVVNEGPIEFRVTFKNPDSGEYEFFEMCYNAVSNNVEHTLQFKGKVREQLSSFINLENPIDVPVTYNLHGAEKYVTYPSFVTVEPYSVTKVMLICCMKTAEIVDTSITANCEELGTSKFNLNIIADPPIEEQSISFSCELGLKDTKTVLFENDSDNVAEFIYSFDDEQFYIDRCATTPAGTTSRIVIGFEPFSLEPAQGHLFLISSATGLYIYPLHGDVKMPSPKGPFHIKPSSSAVIEFKNPFKEDQRFEYTLQPAIFSCDFNSSEIVKARKSVKFLISANFGAELQTNCCTTGQLTIYASNEPNIEWKYYLQYDP